MNHLSAKVRISAALIAVAASIGLVVGCSDNNGYDRCPDWQCGDGLFFAPYIVPAYGVYGQPGYRAPVTIQPGQPNYRPTYVGKPPNFTPPSGAKVNPSNAKPPANYKPPSGSTLTVQKAPQKTGNTQPGSSSGGSSKSSGGGQTVQKAPAPKPAASAPKAPSAPSRSK